MCKCLSQNGYGITQLTEPEQNETRSDLSLAMLLAVFLPFLFSTRILHVRISACIGFYICGFLHFFFSMLRSFCIFICPAPYPLHLLCFDFRSCS